MTRLNLGSGDDKRDGYIGVDIRSGPAVQLIADISKSLPLEDNSVEEILANDILEHLQRYEVEPALREFYRVLKPKGRIRIKSPNIRLLAFALAAGTIPDIEFERKIYGGQDYEKRPDLNTHKCGFSPAMLIWLLTKCGFEIVSRSDSGEAGDWSNLIVEAEKP